MRRLAVAALGAGVVLAAALPAVAAGPAAPAWPDLDRGSTRHSHQATYVVHRGDTLWGIARHHLGGRPSRDAVAKAWPAWYLANHRAIGPDPDLIRPGQRLHAPSAVTR